MCYLHGSELFFIVLLILGVISLTKASNQTISRDKRQSKCVRREFTCNNGDCLDRLYLCDGQSNCADGSDEIFQTCRSILCPQSKFTFRCDYGACISSNLRCNGVVDCVDGSDESDCFVREGCNLPDHLKYGTFSLPDSNIYTPKKLVATGSYISLTCNAKKDEVRYLYTCRKHQWLPEIREEICRKPGTCTPIKTTSSQEVLCKRDGFTVSCDEPENGTIASVRCQPFYTSSEYKPIYRCQNGEWFPSFTSCFPECGVKTVGATTLTIGGSVAIQNEYPWVVALYNGTNHQICAATIISRYYVVTAAHCFAAVKANKAKPGDYTIIAGKHYRDIKRKEEAIQIKKIKNLIIHEDYRGGVQKFRDDIAIIEIDEKFNLSDQVRPICVDWENNYEDFDFFDGNEGVVTGWGNTQEIGAPSEVLKKLVVPYRSRRVCQQELPEDFQQQYYTSDKFCAGYKDKNANVCSGDSGGGLYFKSDAKNFYIRGIVSIAVRSEVGCSANNYALYTRVSNYLRWMEEKTKKLL